MGGGCYAITRREAVQPRVGYCAVLKRGASRDRTVVVMRNGEERVLRMLQPEDRERFGHFLEGLSDSSRERYNPHPLTAAHAAEICRNLDGEASVRAVATIPSTETIVAYVLAEVSVPSNEELRYRAYGVDLPPSSHRIAPVVADSEQGRGLGSALTGWVLEMLRQSGVPIVILFGGVHADNSPALHLYERLGFVRAGSFFKEKAESYDMYVSYAENVACGER